MTPRVGRADPPRPHRLSGHFRDLRTLSPQSGTNVCHECAMRAATALWVSTARGVIVEDTIHFRPCSTSPSSRSRPWRSGTGAADRLGRHPTPIPVRRELAEIFNIGQHQVRVVAPSSAEGLGEVLHEDRAAGGHARNARPAVRVGLSGPMHSDLVQTRRKDLMRTGARRDGTIIGRRSRSGGHRRVRRRWTRVVNKTATARSDPPLASRRGREPRRVHEPHARRRLPSTARPGRVGGESQITRLA